LVRCDGTSIERTFIQKISEFAIAAVALSGLGLLSIKRERWIELSNKIKQLIEVIRSPHANGLHSDMSC
jgi:hypothetical protein